MEKEKLIFKVDKGTMGNYNYIGFRKWIGKNPALCQRGGDYLIVSPDEYMEIGFVNKPDISNWNSEIDTKEFEHGKYGDVLGSGSFSDIESLLETYSNFKQIS